SVSCSPEYRAFPPGRTILRRTKTNRLSAEAQCEPFLTPGFVRATSWVYVASQEVATDCITRSESLKNCAACPLGSTAPCLVSRSCEKECRLALSRLSETRCGHSLTSRFSSTKPESN